MCRQQAHAERRTACDALEVAVAGEELALDTDRGGGNQGIDRSDRKSSLRTDTHDSCGLDVIVLVSEEEWKRSNKALIEQEKAATRERDAPAAERRRQPMVEISPDYEFEGPVTFSIMTERVRFAPQGLLGGGPARSNHFIRDPDGNRIEAVTFLK